jgi:hypothetical protein
VKNPSVCVIGAGCSGITAVKNLIQAGVTDVVCFEQNDRIGGNWIYSPKITHSSVCETTHIISSKELSSFMDWHMPEHYPDYPSHEQVLAFFESYAQHFNLYPYIRFNSKVRKVKKVKDEKWQVELETGDVRIFDYLFVSNGHHSVPRHPELPGNFSGDYIHSHSFKTNEPFKDKRVLVIGAGNSGCDCAVETGRVSSFTAISIRTPQYIVPKFFLGKPVDSFNLKLQWLPGFITSPLQKYSLKLQMGNYADYGLPEPDFPVVKAHPTVNSELLYMIRHGKVHPRNGIKSINGKHITFADGVTEEFDCIIAATGYKIALPFFDKDFINYEEADRVPLYLRMFHPDHRTLVFIGLVQPQGAIWPLSDYQSKLASNFVMGRWKLPENIKILAEKDADYIEKQFLKRKRHTIEVHYHSYLKSLLKEIPANAPDWEFAK